MAAMVPPTTGAADDTGHVRHSRWPPPVTGRVLQQLSHQTAALAQARLSLFFTGVRPPRCSRWPAHYETLLERLRDRHGYSRGTREFIGILQLHQDWDLDRVSSAIQEALDAHCIELEAVRHILMREDTPTRSHAPLESGLMPGITDLTIARADLDQYDRLLAGGVR